MQSWSVERSLWTPFEHDRTAEWYSKLWQSLANVAIVVGVIIVATVATVLLYKYRCYKVGPCVVHPLAVHTHHMSVRSKSKSEAKR